jgi:hypothetical protein
MIRRLQLATIVLIVIAGTVDAQQGSDWIKFEPLGGGFTVLMPSKPEEEIKNTDDFTMHLFTFATESTIYLASYGDYAPSVRIDVDSLLAANRDNFAEGLNARVIASKSITMDGRPGLEFTAQNSEAWIKSRIFLFGNRVHQIAVATPNGETENARRFLSSFAFTGVSTPPKQSELGP